MDETFIQLNLFHLKKQLEIKQGREISLAEMAEGMGLNYYGLSRSIKGNTSAIEFDTLKKMLDYFRQQGLDIQVSDLFVEGKNLPAEVLVAG